MKTTKPKRCRHAATYKAKRIPTCGCNACRTKFAKRIARQIWKHDYEEASDGFHTVCVVLDLAKAWR